MKMKRTLALILCALYALMAGTALAAELPEHMFVSITDLLELCQTTNSGNGLLATGTTSDVKLRISFGHRPQTVQYSDGDFSEMTSVGPGPMVWLLAGVDNGALVLYSEEPLLGKTPFSTNLYSNEYEGTQVPANHWGASDLRKNLQNLASMREYFSASEQALMIESKITTPLDQSSPYTTDDILYAPAGEYDVYDKMIKVGSYDSLSIDKAYWGGVHWLRSPFPRDDRYALITHTRYITDEFVNSSSVAASAAFALNTDNLLFASAANVAVGSSGVRTDIPSDAPMTLRIRNAGTGEAMISADGTMLRAEAAEGARLMIQGVDSDGTNWFYSKTLTGSEQLSVRDIDPKLISLLDCEVWLERDMPDGGTLTYAQPAQISNDFAPEPDSGWPNDQESRPLPETGDGTNMILWLGLLAISAIGIASFSRMARREN